MLVTSGLACSAEPSTEDASHDLIGGTDATEAELDAVGKVTADGQGVICTGTLVLPQIVMTARHCRWNAANADHDRSPRVSFVVRDRHFFEVERELTTGRVGHGLLGLGRDAAFYFLKEPVPAELAKPIAVRARPLDASDEGKKLVVVGYGHGSKGTRTKGQSTLDSTTGRPYERAFDSEEAFRAFVDAAKYPADVSASLHYHDAELTAEAYEVHGGLAKGGLAPGDAQACFGDSGGPLLERVGDHYELVGITTGGEQACVLGTVYTAMGPELQDVLARSMAASPPWSWACPPSTGEGIFERTTYKNACDGSKHVTCGYRKNIEIEDCPAFGDGFSCVADELPSGRCQRSNVPGAPPAIADEPSAITQLLLEPWTTCTVLRSGKATCRGFDYPAEGKVMLTDAVQLVKGSYGVWALRRDGSVVYWGGDRDGRVGFSTRIETTSLTGFVEIGGNCGRRSNGTVACWEDADRVEAHDVPGITDAIAIAGRAHHACALLQNGHVACWGTNAGGRLGIGSPSSTNGVPWSSDVPVEVIGLTDATSLASGDDMLCATRRNGHVVCWGRMEGAESSTGCASKTCDDGPTRELDHITDAVSLEIGYHRACVLRTGGLVSCWGNTSYQQTPWSDRSTMTPIEITELSRVSKLAMSEGYFGADSGGAGYNHGVCAITEGGLALDCWGTVFYEPVGAEKMKRVAGAPVRILDRVRK